MSGYRLDRQMIYFLHREGARLFCLVALALFSYFPKASADSPLSDTNITDDASLTATFAIEYVVTYSAGANGSITGLTSQTVAHGSDTTTVTAVPDMGYHFLGWSDALTTNPRSDTNITTNTSLTATFAINQYVVAYTAGANGSITGLTSQTVAHGSDTTTVTAVPDMGYHFLGWSDALTTNPRSDTNITTNTSLTATFAINNYMVVFQTDGKPGATLEGALLQNVPHGGACDPVTANAPITYHFENWSRSGAEDLTSNPLTLTNVTEAATLTAHFAINTYTITAANSQNGSITPSGQVVLSHGENQTFTITPAPGYVIHDLLVDDVSTSSLSSYTFENVTEDHTIQPLFADRIPPTIELLGNNPETVEVFEDYVDAGAIAIDLVDGDISTSVTVISDVNSSVTAQYLVRYNVTDSSGNSAVETTRSVHVVDLVAPVITLTGEEEMLVGLNTVFEDPGASAHDNYDGDISGDIVTTNTVNTSIEAEYTITYGVADSSGNSTFSVRTVQVVDMILPVFSNIAAAPPLAGVGTNVVITFNASETLAENPEVTVNGIPGYFVSLNDDAYTFSYTVLADDSEGNAVVEIHGADEAGNVGDAVAADILTLDTTPPSLFDIAADPPVAKLGANIAIHFRTTDTLASTPTVTVNGKLAEFIEANGDTYISSYTILASDTEGAASIDLLVTDWAGNSAMFSDATALSVDLTSPSFSGLTVNPSTAGEGASVTITFILSEEVSEDPVVMLNEHPATLAGQNGLQYTYSYVIQPSDSDGFSTVTLSAVDLALNRGEQITTTTFPFIDRAPPEFTQLAAYPSFAKANKDVILAFVASETLSSLPTLTVNESSAVFVSMKNDRYRYLYHVEETDTEGPIALTIRAADIALNETVFVTSGPLTIDLTPPLFSNLLVAPGAAPEGASVTLTFSASEPLTAQPAVTVNGNPAVFASITGQDYTYYYQTLAQDADPIGPATIVITGSDLAGHPGELISDSAFLVNLPLPTVTMTTTSTNPTSHSVVAVETLFSLPVTGFDSSDIITTNATVQNFVMVDAQTYTFDLVFVTEDILTAIIPAGVAQNSTGGDNLASAPLSRLYKFTSAPYGLVASYGEHTYRIALSWEPSPDATHYRVYRSESETGARSPIAPWQAETSQDDTDPDLVSEKDYYYWVKAVNADLNNLESLFSDFGIGMKAKDVLIDDDDKNNAQYKVTYKNATLISHPTSVNLAFLSNSPKATIKIQRLRYLVSNLSDPARGIQYLRAVRIPELLLSGDFKSIYSEASIRNLTSDGDIRKITVKGGSIEQLVANEIITLKMTAYQKGLSSPPTYAWTSIATGASPERIKINLVGVILEYLDSKQSSASIKTVSKKHRDKETKQYNSSIGGVGSVKRIEGEIWGGETDGVDDTTLVKAPFISFLSTKGCPVVLNHLKADIGKITAVGSVFTAPGGAPQIAIGNIRIATVLSSVEVAAITAKAKKYNGQYYGGFIGYKDAPGRMLVLAPAIKTINGAAGVSGIFIAGYNPITYAPTYFGGIKSIITNPTLGILVGEAHISPDVKSPRFKPGQGALFEVFTSESQL